MPYREVTGGGNVVWGAGFGFDLSDVFPDGGPVAFNACPNDAGLAEIFDVTGMSGRALVSLPFDARAAGYTGIAFYGTSFGTSAVYVVVEMDDARTSPWGGICNPCIDGGKCQDASGYANCPCSDSFALIELFPAGKWQRFSFHFSDFKLSTLNWSGQNLSPGGIDPSTLYLVHFQLASGATGALKPYDVDVAYVTWLTD